MPISARLAGFAAGVAALHQTGQQRLRRERDARCTEVALQTFEGEGGLVLGR